MSGNKCIFILVILGVFEQTLSLVVLPPVEDNDILKAEATIRSTTNTLFYSLGLKKTGDKPKIKQFSLVHNYFVSLTLQDYNSLKEIAKLTRVDKSNIKNETKVFIALINEILDEDNVLKLQSIIMGDDFRTGYDIESEIEKLEYLKGYYAKEVKSIDINKEVLRILQDESFELENTTKIEKPEDDGDEYVLDDNEFWREGQEPISGRRIYNGQQTKIKHYPFMASVQIFNKFQCSGSIIKSDLVITAASCLQLAWNNRFYRENPAFLSVRVGSSFYEVGGENIGVLEVYFYPSYSPKNLHHNIAVMRLLRKIKFKKGRKKRVKKIELDKEEHGLPVNTNSITVVGWGARTAGNKLHGPWQDKIKFSVLSIYDLEDCQEIYSKEYVTGRNFCAGFISVGSGACNRDVGGPGIVSGILAGVISFGAPVCGTPDAPTVFTKVGYYYDWIEEIMEQDVPSIRQRTTLIPKTYVYGPPKTSTRKKIYTITPISYLSGTRTTTTTQTYTIDKASAVRNQHLDKKMFKEFLKTMFESNEIKEYLDIMRETASPKLPPKTPQQFKIAPISVEKAPSAKLIEESPKSPLRVTRMDNVEPITKTSPETSQEDIRNSNFTAVITKEKVSKQTLFTEEPEIKMEYDEDPNYVDIVDRNENQVIEQDPDKELEDRILKLVNSAGMPEEAQINDDKLASRNLPEILRDPKNEAVVKDKIDQAILTLLYLSDSEKGKEGINFKDIDRNATITLIDDRELEDTYDAQKGKAESVPFAGIELSRTFPTTVKIKSKQVLPLPSKDYNYRGSVNPTQDQYQQLSNFLSKNVVFDILKQALDVNSKANPLKVTQAQADEFSEEDSFTQAFKDAKALN